MKRWMRGAGRLAVIAAAAGGRSACATGWPYSISGTAPNVSSDVAQEGTVDEGWTSVLLTPGADGALTASEAPAGAGSRGGVAALPDLSPFGGTRYMAGNLLAALLPGTSGALASLAGAPTTLVGSVLQGGAANLVTASLDTQGSRQNGGGAIGGAIGGSEGATIGVGVGGTNVSAGAGGSVSVQPGQVDVGVNLGGSLGAVAGGSLGIGLGLGGQSGAGALGGLVNVTTNSTGSGLLGR